MQLRFFRVFSCPLFFGLLALTVACPSVFAQDGRKRVLILNSYHPGFPWSDGITYGMVETLRAAHPDIDIRIEYMDTKRQPSNLDSPYMRHVLDYLRHKYEGMHLDAVLCSDGWALRFAHEHRDGLLAGAPVVFCGAHGAEVPRMDRSQFTGLLEFLDREATVDLALRLHPEAHRLVVITNTAGGATANYEPIRDHCRRNHPDRELVLLDAKDLSGAELVEAMRCQPPGTVAIFSDFFHDRTGAYISPKWLVPTLARESDVPMYVYGEAYFGLGVVGGKITSGYHHGRDAATMALRILDGESPADIPIQETSLNRHLFDWRQLKRFGIDESELPAGSQVHFHPYSVYEEHRELIWAVGIGFVVMGLLVAVLAGNILRRRRAEREQRELQQQLHHAHKMEAIGQLAGGIAHDFNNLLAIIQGNAELLAGRHEAGEAHEHVRQIVRAAKRGSSLTGQLLAFARKGAVREEPVDVHAAIDEVASILTHGFDRSITVRRQFAAEQHTVLTDPAQLHSALLNLALNARDAMPDGGELLLATTNRQIDRAERKSGAPRGGSYVEIVVRDTGEGIPEDVLPRIFEPFFTTKEPGKGTGLGLAAVYGFAQTHRGAIDVESRPGEGATFRMLLPTAKAPAAARPPRQEPAPRRPEGGILVVDDEELVRRFAASALRDRGYCVAECADGQEAVEYFRENHERLSLVLLDLVMPNLGGADAFRQMRRVNPDVPVLLWSGYVGNDGATAVLEEGACGLLNKPFDLDDLYLHVDRHARASAQPCC